MCLSLEFSPLKSGFRLKFCEVFGFRDLGWGVEVLCRVSGFRVCMTTERQQLRGRNVSTYSSFVAWAACLGFGKGSGVGRV